MAMPKNAFVDKLRSEADFYRAKGDPDLAWIATVLDLKSAHAEFLGATSAADYQDRVEALLRADMERIEAERMADTYDVDDLVDHHPGQSLFSPYY